MSEVIKEKESTEIEPSRKRPLVYTPFEDLFGEIFGDFDRIFEDYSTGALEEFSRQIIRFRPITRFPRLDIEDTGDAYKVTADMPGISKDKVNINVTSDSLEISGGEEKDVTDKNYLHRERFYESFRRYVVFKEDILSDKVEAEIKDGILTIKIPKKYTAHIEEPVKVEVKED
ncbi:MAG: Hsp20/alpha crystallin family protein [Candidatus Freyarchaeum deiterrae]